MAAHWGNIAVIRFARCCGQLLLVLACSCGTRVPVVSDTVRDSDERDDNTADGGRLEESNDNSPTHDGQEELVDGCADLDTDGVPDCETTRVSNPSFTTGSEGWIAVDDTELDWDPKNALSDLPSGSLKLFGRGTFVEAMHCVPLDGESLVVAYANTLVATKEQVEGARALVEISYFGSDDCSGEPEGFFETPPSDALNEWTTVYAGSVSTRATRAVSISLIGVKTGAAVGHDVEFYFDNVLFDLRDAETREVASQRQP